MNCKSILELATGPRKTSIRNGILTERMELAAADAHTRGDGAIYTLFMAALDGDQTAHAAARAWLVTRRGPVGSQG